MRIFKLVPFGFSCAILLSLFYSCSKPFKYSPNEIRIDQKDRDLNSKNLQRLSSKKEDSSFRFIVMADCQRSYDELEDFVMKANSYQNISFVILNGDFTDFGLLTEYLWTVERMRSLLVPFLVVIGNHDMLGNGREIYRQMFGPENFGFSYSGYRFIVLNTNSNETGYNGSLPDTTWLQREVSNTPGQEKIFLISHIAPFSLSFDPALSSAYSRITKEEGNVVYSIHGHEERFIHQQWYGPPVNYLVVNGIKNRAFVLINVSKDQIEVEELSF